ncbi:MULTISPECIES: GNAT family N-acetyltransferase [Paenibacillus]|uniref:GNAT superfamily N-acetyltransferase n=1 Tax=Paenibacillus xylanexedens TaxID=528191 RepID=A0ABS4S1M8_PAEXY|nr:MULTISPECIES: GNAT family N-acetyltransferase [Paenibacillus]MBP2249036.1 GNAT superfamily N-acetyltransferase [Paenibacillus xylanexedens]WFA87631.1 GNAT family N-acetyltransferase [Paenibacillus amylolyticus]
MEMIYKDYLISDDKSKLDKQVILDFLVQSYWANRRPQERILRSIENSHCFGVYHNDKQIAFARVVTDNATVYYLCDVFVLKEYQGQGIGKKLVEQIVNSDEYEWMSGILGTLDAHSLYEQYGFERDLERSMRRIPQGRKTM